jgi:hypothetical protein
VCVFVWVGGDWWVSVPVAAMSPQKIEIGASNFRSTFRTITLQTKLI